MHRYAVDKYDRHWRGPIPEARDTQGISTELRNLVLDSVTFEKMLKYDMEVWHWEECEMAYAAACFWYGAVGATSNIDRVRIGGAHRGHQPILGDGEADLVVIGFVAEVAGHAAAAAGVDLDVIARRRQRGHVTSLPTSALW